MKRKKKNHLDELILGLASISGLYYFIGDYHSMKQILVLIALIVFTFIAYKYYHKMRKDGERKQQREKYLSCGITTVDKMSGEEFELFLCAHYENQGYIASTTPKTKDYGADLILERDNVRTVVQAKRYSSKVSNKAIQEVVGAIKYYKAQEAWVVTSNFFTKEAENLASANNVKLIDRNELIELMSANGCKDIAEKILDDTVSNMICPECQSPLIQKNGRYGVFIGCSAYPKCKFTR